MKTASNVVMSSCRQCGTSNRIPSARVQDNPACGKCHAPLYRSGATVLLVPGTTTPFPVYERKGPPPLKTDAQAKQRRGLLAKIHIAKAQMGLNDGEYEMILNAFKVSTAADLTLPQLENCVKLLKHYGWKPRKSRKAAAPDDRLAALRRRCVEEAKGLYSGEKRLAGLALKICGVSQLAWCKDAAKLERLLAVLAKIKEGAS